MHSHFEPLEGLSVYLVQDGYEGDATVNSTRTTTAACSVLRVSSYGAGTQLDKRGAAYEYVLVSLLSILCKRLQQTRADPELDWRNQYGYDSKSLMDSLCQVSICVHCAFVVSMSVCPCFRIFVCVFQWFLITDKNENQS